MSPTSLSEWHSGTGYRNERIAYHWLTKPTGRQRDRGGQSFSWTSDQAGIISLLYSYAHNIGKADRDRKIACIWNDRYSTQTQGHVGVAVSAAKNAGYDVYLFPNEASRNKAWDYMRDEERADGKASDAVLKMPVFN